MYLLSNFYILCAIISFPINKDRAKKIPRLAAGDPVIASSSNDQPKPYHTYITLDLLFWFPTHPIIFD